MPKKKTETRIPVTNWSPILHPSFLRDIGSAFWAWEIEKYQCWTQYQTCAMKDENPFLRPGIEAWLFGWYICKLGFFYKVSYLELLRAGPVKTPCTYLTVWLRNGGMTDRPTPALDSNTISTPSLLFLKYCPIITSRLFWAMDIPIPMNSPETS